MMFCINGICHWIPIYYLPIFKPGPPQPDPRPWWFQDLMVIATINEAVTNIADEGARRAFKSGIVDSVKSLQDKIGKDGTIKLDVPARH